NLIDTGGIELSEETLLLQIRQQAEIAIEEADVIIFLVNGRHGVTAADEEVAKILYKSNKPTVLGVNKVDNPEMRHERHEIYGLGFGEPYPISGTHGLGLGGLFDEVVSHLPDDFEEERVEDTVYFSFIGRPIVGKAYFANA